MFLLITKLIKNLNFLSHRNYTDLRKLLLKTILNLFNYEAMILEQFYIKICFVPKEVWVITLEKHIVYLNDFFLFKLNLFMFCFLPF